MPSSPLLIAFEGSDGSGKSTQSRLLAERLGAVHTRQAGGTPLGLKIRALTLDPESAGISARAEAMLYMADRAEQAETVVRPALEGGQHVVSDRWAYSSMAYQGARHGLSVEELSELASWSTEGLWPDVVFYIDVSPEVGLARAGGTDHYESSGTDLQVKTRQIYKQLAQADPTRWIVVDGDPPVEVVSEKVWESLQNHLGN